MLRESETSCSASVLTDDDLAYRCAALEAPSEKFRLFGEGSPSDGDSFFFIAMRVSRPGARACRRQRIR
jgi:hypothetical protein